MRARLAKKLLKLAMADRLSVGTIVPGTLLVLQHDGSITPSEAEQLLNQIRTVSPCTSLLMLDEHVRIADVQHPNGV